MATFKKKKITFDNIFVPVFDTVHCANPLKRMFFLIIHQFLKPVFKTAPKMSSSVSF